jgi:hypothetical protein
MPGADAAQQFHDDRRALSTTRTAGDEKAGKAV